MSEAQATYITEQPSNARQLAVTISRMPESDIEELEEHMSFLQDEDSLGHDEMRTFQMLVIGYGAAWDAIETESLIKLSPEVQWFAEQMELALRDNDHKNGWENCSQDWLLEQLYRNASKITKTNTILRKPVNVANFAMMIAHNARLHGTEGTHEDR